MTPKVSTKALDISGLTAVPAVAQRRSTAIKLSGWSLKFSEAREIAALRKEKFKNPQPKANTGSILALSANNKETDPKKIVQDATLTSRSVPIRKTHQLVKS